VDLKAGPCPREVSPFFSPSSSTADKRGHMAHIYIKEASFARETRRERKRARCSECPKGQKGRMIGRRNRFIDGACKTISRHARFTFPFGNPRDPFHPSSRDGHGWCAQLSLAISRGIALCRTVHLAIKLAVFFLS